MYLLLFSNSTNFGEPYFEFPQPFIRNFLKNEAKNCLFFPYAGITISWNDYEQRIREKFKNLGHQLVSVHHSSDPVKSIEDAEVIVIGGGNTFNLIYWIQKLNLIEPIRKKVLNGAPYIGWSAGSNVACPTICTTNDMPVIQPFSFQALDILNFQINPHFTDGVIPNHGGETREARLLEYLEINQDKKVLGLREGSLIECIDNDASLQGVNGGRLFQYGKTPVDYQPGASLSFLFK